MKCPACNSQKFIKNGSVHNGKQKYGRNDCGRRFAENPQNKIIPRETWDIADKSMLEKIPIAGISRVTGILEPWLQKYINEKYEDTPEEIDITKKGRLTTECDEMWSFVGMKADKKWIWQAIDCDSREIVGVYVGSRDRVGAEELWKSLPPVYRQCAVSYSDFQSAYEKVMPQKRHRPVGKESGKTDHIERFNLTMRQRISRLVRKTLSFSKKLENHIGAIWFFIHHYNSEIAPKLATTTTC
jgi:IS1 family transposase/transposase-like protein